MEVIIDDFNKSSTATAFSRFRIGGVSFQVCSRPNLPWLRTLPYTAFDAGEAEIADVTLRLRRLDRRCLRLPAPERATWPSAVQAEDEHVSGQLLGAGPVQRWLAQARPARIALHERWLAGLDFAARTGDFFYLPRRRIEFELNGETASVTHIHHLKADQSLAPPLTVLPRLHPACVAEGPAALPVLRAPQAQRWLLARRPIWPDLLMWGNSEFLRVFNQANHNLDVFYYPDGNLADVTALSFIRRLTAAYFPIFGKVQIHCSGVVRQGPGGARAALFLAQSGGGKTTTARLHQGGTLLSDDQVVVERRAGQFLAHATPFARLPITAAQAPVRALIMLEKAPTFFLQRCPATDVALHLHNDHTTYTRWLPTPLKRQVSDFFCDLAFTVPTYRMGFPKDFVNWAAVDAALGGV